ncbi:MAG: hypothetical protein ACE5I4_06700 [Thermoplasmata archaeon]
MAWVTMAGDEALTQREGERLLDFLERSIRARGGARRLILGMDRYREVQDSVGNDDFGRVSIGGRHPFQNISHIFGVPVEVDYHDKNRLEFLD